MYLDDEIQSYQSSKSTSNSTKFSLYSSQYVFLMVLNNANDVQRAYKTFSINWKYLYYLVVSVGSPEKQSSNNHNHCAPFVRLCLPNCIGSVTLSSSKLAIIGEIRELTISLSRDSYAARAKAVSHEHSVAFFFLFEGENPCKCSRFQLLGNWVNYSVYYFTVIVENYR